MPRLKTTVGFRPPASPSGNWLAGLIIGSAIVTFATQAMLLGVSAALSVKTLKGE